ncbi:MAG: ABC transporter permease [Sedimentisphaerales bacterium]|nr:ABC transporter permease [Sedimentisphaerales bacterium]MBN2842206.1 ABC transporter permease [Sedimentisphaerales bacterium]
MSGFTAVCKREFKGYFATPVAYVFLIIFLAAAGYLPFKDRFFDFRQADMRLFFKWLPVLYIFMVPSVAMRLWAEERRSGSIELLFTLPITVWQAVLGKFLAAWFFLAIALALTFPMPITVCYLGDPDMGQIITGYMGALLMAGAYLAVGCFFSALTRNQVISFILSVVACSVLYSIGLPSSIDALNTILPGQLVGAIEKLSFENHFESMQRGVIQLSDLGFFAVIISGWVWACTLILEERKAQ